MTQGCISFDEIFVLRDRAVASLAGTYSPRTPTLTVGAGAFLGPPFGSSWLPSTTKGGPRKAPAPTVGVRRHYVPAREASRLQLFLATPLRAKCCV
jgi:hypothetical protein